MKHPLFLFALFPITAFSAPSASFDGCKGLSVTRARDFSLVDVSEDLKKAEKRISDLCGKTIPKKLKTIDDNAKSCLSGASVDTGGAGIASQMVAKTQAQMRAFDQRIKEACDAMKKTMAESKRACGVRKSTLAQLDKSIATIQQAQSDQTSSQTNVAALYGGAVSAYGNTAKSAGAAKDKIYAQLPDKDENRREQMRSGEEGASTDDFKTDQLIADWKPTLTSLAKGNKNKAACEKLVAKGGQLDEMSRILKNNLWPNGKLAARAMARIESADKEKAAEFTKLQAEATKRGKIAGLTEESEGEKSAKSARTTAETASLGAYSTMDGHVGPVDLTPAPSQGSVEACRKSGSCQTGGAVQAAIRQAETKQNPPVDLTPSSAYTAAGDYTGMSDPVSVTDPATRAPSSMAGESCIASVWQWSSMWYVKKMGVKNSAGKCVVN